MHVMCVREEKSIPKPTEFLAVVVGSELKHVLLYFPFLLGFVLLSSPFVVVVSSYTLCVFYLAVS
jgi:hypothetical protein